ncbi:MAG: hypothetical protein ACXACY_27685 [Candidatus Hodarchaeales archaeon]
MDSQEFEVTLKGKTAEIMLPDSLKLDSSAPLGKFSTVRDTFTFISGVDEVVFSEVHKRLAPPAKKEKKPKKQKIQKNKKKTKSKSS